MFAILIVGFIFVALAIGLPYFSGLATYQKQARPKRAKTDQHSSAASSGSAAYLPPDEAARQARSEEPQHESFRDRVRITADELPVRMTLNESGQSLRKRREKLDTDRDPNHYDYDIDELINEEGSKAAAEQRAQFYRDEPVGKLAKEIV